MTASPATIRSVLVVDDDANLRRTLCDYVRSLDKTAWEAAHGLEALWIVKHQRPDLVLLDLTMPRLDGFETIRHIRKFDPSIRVVVITGDPREEIRLRVASLGLDLLLKPLEPAALDAVFGSS